MMGQKKKTTLTLRLPSHLALIVQVLHLRRDTVLKLLNVRSVRTEAPPPRQSETKPIGDAIREYVAKGKVKARESRTKITLVRAMSEGLIRPDIFDTGFSQVVSATPSRAGSRPATPGRHGSMSGMPSSSIFSSYSPGASRPPSRPRTPSMMPRLQLAQGSPSRALRGSATPASRASTPSLDDRPREWTGPVFPLPLAPLGTPPAGRPPSVK